MSTIQEQLARTQRFMDLQAKHLNLTMRVMPGTVSDEVVDGLEQLVGELRDLAESANPDDQLTPRRMVEERIADATEWLARAHDSLRHPQPAIQNYERASRLYAALGDAAAVRRIEDKAAELRLHSGQDIDAEYKRLAALLEEAAPGSLERAKILVALGELSSHAGDDHGALKWLTEAEEILSREPHRLPDASSTLSALAGTIAAIHSGTSGGAPTAIEKAMALRAIHQRLLFALSNAYQTINPEKAATYEKQVEAMDADRSSGGSREALLESMKKLLG